MQWKKLAKKSLFPPLWLTAVLTVLCTVALVLIFVKKLEESPLAYAVYVVSFYTVCVISIFLGITLPKKYKSIKQKVYNHPIGNRYMTDITFKTHISLYFSLAVNLLYVGVNIISFVLYRSMWFVILASYYTVLAVMRFILVRFVREIGIGKDRLSALKRSRLCGIILLAVNFALSGAVLMMVYQNKGYDYHGILIYIMAMYTFFITTQSILNLIKYKKIGSPVMSMSKIINMTAALVSMLNLETAMFSQFGADMSQENKRLMIILTGAAISIIVVTMALYSIIKNTKEIKYLRG